jgi:hypothetical protein
MTREMASELVNAFLAVDRTLNAKLLEMRARCTEDEFVEVRRSVARVVIAINNAIEGAVEPYPDLRPQGMLPGRIGDG